MEISPFRIKFEYIKGIKNTLADTMSRLLRIDPDLEQPPEPEGYEFGCFAFDKLPAITVELLETEEPQLTKESLKLFKFGDLKTRIRDEQFKDDYCRRITELLLANKVSDYKFCIENGLLHRYIEIDKQKHKVVVLPDTLIEPILHMAHDDLGHNGTNRTYKLLKKHVFWKGMKPMIQRYIRICQACRARNIQVVKYPQMHFETAAMPMQFISMDLIGPFSPPTTQGNVYALTVICMLTGYVFCIPIPNKETETVIRAYMNHVYYPYGGSIRILSDNGTEFKNAKFEEVAKRLGVQHKIYTAPYTPTIKWKNRRFS